MTDRARERFTSFNVKRFWPSSSGYVNDDGHSIVVAAAGFRPRQSLIRGFPDGNSQDKMAYSSDVMPIFFRAKSRHIEADQVELAVVIVAVSCVCQVKRQFRVALEENAGSAGDYFPQGKFLTGKKGPRPALEGDRGTGYFNLGIPFPPRSDPTMNSLLRGLLLAIVVIASFLTSARAAESARYEILIDAGKHTRNNVPVRVDLAVPLALQDVTQAFITSPDGRTMAGQLTARSLLSEPMIVEQTDVPRQLCFILDKLEASGTVKLEATIVKPHEKPADEFGWRDTAGKYADLMVRDRPLLRYMYEPLDESSKDRREETYKVYHHVFDPAGELLVTKGPGGLFPHHRGLFFGFNRIEYGGGKKADTWHCTDKAFQSHDGVASQEAGPVLGRHVVKVGWHGQEGEKFANEERELTVYRQSQQPDGKPAGTLIEFASLLRTAGGEINLDGDPQHAGFQFRPSQEVPDKTKDQTYYVRVDGVGKPGEFRNWPDQKDQINFPWKGLSFVLGDQRYTVANLDRPENPKESRFSERDYGRFGSYFTCTVSEEKPLKLNYRIWLQPGEMTVEQIDAMAKDFTEPPTVSVKRI